MPSAVMNVIERPAVAPANFWGFNYGRQDVHPVE